MSSPERDYDLHTLRRLTSAVMDGQATTEEQQELTEMLRTHEAARDDYLTLVDVHAILATEVVASDARVEKQTSVSSESSRIGSRAAAIVIAASAASILLAFTWIRLARVNDLQTSTTAPPAPSINENAVTDAFATVVQSNQAEWNSNRELKAGDRIGRSNLRIRSGIVRIEFDSGVDVTLQGPAEFELFGGSKTKLMSGLLTANVPSGAEGFVVDTPTAEVVDLGTSFGIDLREPGFSNVAVFDGKVEVALRDATEKHLLREGESFRISGDRQIEKVEIEPERFAKVWPVSSGIVESTEAFRFLPPWPKRIRFINSDHDIFVAVEGFPVRLRSNLSVDVSMPGTYSLVSDLTPMELSQGERVRSYILHFHPENPRSVRRTKRVSGSITFDRPILGLIIQHEQLLASSRRFSRHGAGEIQRRRQLNLTDEVDGDRISLSDDRRTLTVDLISPGRSSDLIRVIVDGRGRWPRPPRRQLR